VGTGGERGGWGGMINMGSGLVQRKVSGVA